MVKIEKLVMQGFKSFQRKVSVPFPTGFSVVTGPNGSGKSNILDSICFVLGKTSAKTLSFAILPREQQFVPSQ